MLKMIVQRLLKIWWK